eukprot:2483098-Prymnesium_polylepis.1
MPPDALSPPPALAPSPPPAAPSPLVAGCARVGGRSAALRAARWGALRGRAQARGAVVAPPMARARSKVTESCTETRGCDGGTRRASRGVRACVEEMGRPNGVS